MITNNFTPSFCPKKKQNAQSVPEEVLHKLSRKNFIAVVPTSLKNGIFLYFGI